MLICVEQNGKNTCIQAPEGRKYKPGVVPDYPKSGSKLFKLQKLDFRFSQAVRSKPSAGV
ncbi:MAG: hypothetical protein PHV51_04690 [Methanosarcinaceae archaeon]|nr:hypothetical protein [Methanosarcinaceae archaeon]MDD4497435.1 hypothetical protein [Methanosarcinaceae archaeon]